MCWSNGDILWVADKQDDQVHSHNLPNLTITPPIELERRDVDFGECAEHRTGFSGTAADGLRSTTVTASPKHEISRSKSCPPTRNSTPG